MKRNYLILALAVISVAILSCKKDIVEMENTYPTSLGSGNALANSLAQNGPQTQSFSFNAAAGYNFIGTSGTKVYIPANAFLYASQQPVTGTVTVTMIEVYNKRDMICSGGFTTANGLPIISGGEIELRAYQGNNELIYNPAAGPMTVKFPVTNPDSQMELFVANDISEGSDYNRVDSSLFVTTDTSWTPVPSPYYYQVYTTGLGWINCDYFYSYPGNLTNVTVSVPAIFNDTNTMIVCVFPNLNMASSLWYYTDATHSFDLGTGYKIPVGIDTKFIAMSDINGQLYWGEVTLNVADQQTLSITPVPVSQAQFDQNLDALN